MKFKNIVMLHPRIIGMLLFDMNAKIDTYSLDGLHPHIIGMLLF